MSKIINACINGRKADLKTIETCARLKHNFNLVDKDGKTGLIFACQNGNTIVVLMLINLKVDVDLDKVDKDGCTALHYACIRGYPVIITLLITAGANLNITNRKGITPLMYAIRHNKIPVAIQLLNRGVEMEHACINGTTPLIDACKLYYENQELVNALLSKYSLVSLDIKSDAIPSQNFCDHQDNEGNTALHYAIPNGYKNLVYIELFKRGANPHLKNKNGESVMDIIEKMENTTGPRPPNLLFVDMENKDVKFSIRKQIAPYAYHPRFATHFRLVDDADA
jgi:ankyrin repeat protein